MTTETKLKFVNEWIDFWYNEIGVNIIPIDTKERDPISVTWIEWQNNPIPKEKLEEWKALGLYEKYGAGVIAGKLWRGKNKGLYLCEIDLDNKKGIEEFCSAGIDKTAQRTLVEQHKDNTNKAHVYYLTHKPVIKKSSNKNDPEFKDKIDDNQIPSIEVKGAGKHGLMYATPSIHKNGQRYEIIGIKEILVYDDIEKIIDDVCSNYDIPYLEIAKDGKALMPMSELYKKGIEIHEGSNRHEAVMRYMESKMTRNPELSDETILKITEFEFNQPKCKPPLPPNEMQKQLRDARKFINTKNQEKKPETISEFTDMIMGGRIFKTLDDTKEILYYNEGYYKKGGEVIIEKECERIVNDCHKKHSSEVIAAIQRRTYVNRDIFNNDFSSINLNNGILDLNTGELSPHTPHFLTTFKIPTNYNPKAQCPQFIRFLKQCLDENESISRTLQLISCILLGPISPINKICINLGRGANGKTTLYNIITQIIGKENTTNISLHTVCSDRFSLAELYEKLANFFLDISGKEIEEVSNVKVLTGGDRIMAQRKFKDPFYFSPYAKHFFSANEMPSIPDSSDAMARRIEIIDWGKQFFGKDDIKKLSNKIYQEESEGILTLLFNIARGLLKSETLLHSKPLKEIKETLKLRADPIEQFIAAKCNISLDKFSLRSLVYSKYVQFCLANGFIPTSDKTFISRMKAKGFIATDKFTEGKSQKVYLGIELLKIVPKNNTLT